MKVTIDTTSETIRIEQGEDSTERSLYSPEGFEALSELWLKVGWDQKYVYTFSWLDRPIIQLPEDLIRVQEVICALQPDVILECGIAHGGSLVFYASLCKLLGRGRVIGVDIEIRPHNRAAIEAHPLFPYITLVEASSTDPSTVSIVAKEIDPGSKTLVILDSAHTKDHVLAELEAYAPFVSVGSYVIVADGIMELVADSPRGVAEWTHDNPISAVEEFVGRHPEFVVEQPRWQFNESALTKNLTHWPRGYLRRVA